VLGKRIKLRVRSIKGCWLDLCRDLIDLGGFFQKELDTTLNLLDSGKLRGLGVKPPLLLPQIEQRAGRGIPPAALVAMGAGAPGGLGFVRGEELEEEVDGSSRTCSPELEVGGAGRNLQINAGLAAQLSSSRATAARASRHGSGGGAQGEGRSARRWPPFL
jgi:hypothetical protein